MNYGFDTVIDRHGIGNVKYDLMEKNGYAPDTIPMWVADMDFPAPPEVRKKLAELVELGMYGYTMMDEAYKDAVIGWFSSRIGYRPEREWIKITPGVVFAIGTAIRALTSPGDGVLIQRPVYHPFERLVVANGRKLVNNPLIYQNGKYSIDFNDFEHKLKTENVKLFILCSPHNPVGRVWSADELKTLSGLCRIYGVTVISDEIHCDFIYPGNRFVPYAALGEAALENCIICTAPSKTFNLAGLQLANIFIPNKTLRDKYSAELWRAGYGEPGFLAMHACRAAYEHGAPWLDALVKYLSGNLNLLRTALQEKLPAVKLVEPQGTYLAWLDFSGLGMDENEVVDILKHKAKLWFDKGSKFGPEGTGFQRVNIACPRSVMEEAVDRLTKNFER